ncbi:MAG: hypothetical protein HY699_06490 [Deltaproteobacteria bacterium]|nr:hypothetical protein [Deltaproteobacteria bacterium]
MTAVLAIAAVYLLPGFGAAAIFSDRARWNPVLWLLGSFVLTPVVLANAGALGIRSSRPAFIVAALLALGAAGQVAGLLLRRRGLALTLPGRGEKQRQRLPWVLSWALVIAFTVCLCGTRMSLLERRGPTIVDDFQRLAHVTAIAATGVPPRYYLSPRLPLSYYYYSLVPAGLLARLAHPDLSIAQALGIHVVLETAMVMLVVQALAFRLCPNPWAAFAMVLFLTFGGGYDFWIVLPEYIANVNYITTGYIEGWVVELFPIYRDILQMSVPSTLAVWVPQHWLAGYGVLLGVALIGGIKGDRRTRVALLGLLLAFVAGCSVFAAFGLGAGVALWFVCGLRDWRAPWGAREILGAFAVGGALSLTLLATYPGKDPVLEMNDHAVMLMPELQLRSDTLGSFLWAKIQLLPRFLIYLFNDSGVTLPLFLAWLYLDARGIWSDPARRWIAAIGLAFLPFFYLVRSTKFNDFAMRGIIPAQIAWALGSAWLLSLAVDRRLRRLLLALAVVGSLAALPAPAFQLYHEIRRNLLPRPPSVRFVSWINERTPLDALVVLQGLDLRSTWLHSIERIRLVPPADLGTASSGIERQYFQPSRLRALPEVGWNFDNPQAACRTAAELSDGTEPRPLYLLHPRNTPFRGKRFGAPVYQDKDRIIYSVDCPGVIAEFPPA